MNSVLKPYYVCGKVVRGFGRGSKQLGIPTANLESSVVNNMNLENGIYYGFAQLFLNNDEKCETAVNGSETNANTSHKNGYKQYPPIYGMVCSFGWNPHFKNTVRSLEVHILNDFGFDFYGSTLRVAICGYIRAERKFDDLDSLISAIHNDVHIAKSELSDADKWKHVIENQFFSINDKL